MEIEGAVFGGGWEGAEAGIWCRIAELSWSARLIEGTRSAPRGWRILRGFSSGARSAGVGGTHGGEHEGESELGHCECVCVWLTTAECAEVGIDV